MLPLYRIDKRANEPVQRVFDFNPWLQSIGSTAASFSVTDAPDLIESSSNVNQVVVLNLTGGDAGETYRIGVSCVAANGLIRNTMLEVRVLGVRAPTTEDPGGGAANVVDSLAGNSTTDAPSIRAVNAGTIPIAQKGAASGVATLGVDGKVPQAQLPALGAAEYMGEVADEAAMLALPTAPAGSFCTRTDLGTTFMLIAADPSLISSWRQLAYPSSPVTSVAGKNGTVVLDSSDVGLGNVANLAPADLPLSAASTAALAGKADTVHVHDIEQVTGLAGTLDLKSNVGHVHAIADVTGLQTGLDAKAPSIHSHPISSISNLQTTLDAKANAADVAATLADYETLAGADTIRQSLQGQIDQKYGVSNIATQSLAEAGVDNATLMTPLRTKQAIDALGGGGGGGSLSASNLLDARSLLMMPGNSLDSTRYFTAIGPRRGEPAIIAGNFFLASTGSTAVTGWIGGTRGRVVSGTAAQSQAKLTLNTALQFPQAAATASNWKARYTFAAADALTGCRGFCGFVRTAETIAASTEISSTATGKIGFGYDSTDTNLQLFVGNTKTNLGASFPAHGDRVNPYLIELDCKSGAEHGIDWTVTHIDSGATTSGTIPSGSVPTNGDLTWWMLRDTALNTGTEAAVETSGLATGGFASLVAGGSSAAEDTSATREITGATSFQASDIGATVRFNSASTAALTLPNDTTMAIGPGKAQLTIFIKGAGVPTITAGTGVTIEGTPPTGLAQGSTLVLNHTGDANTWSYP